MDRQLGNPDSLSRVTRKADGIFYTPPDVASYIVRKTLRPLLAGRRPGEVKQLRILDPACGAGVFLQEAFRLLVGWYGKQRRGQRLDLAARKQILLNHLFGIDKDVEAVAASRLRLARMCLVPDSSVVASRAPRRSLEPLTKALSKNVRPGNALIEPYSCSDHGLHTNRSLKSVDSFDWRDQWTGAFDAVVGNPPYINIRNLTRAHGTAIKTELGRRYACACRSYDVYVLFVERAFQLLRRGGMCGFILPNKIASLDYALPCRRLLLEQTTIHEVDDVTDADLFPGAGVYPYIFVWKKEKPRKNHQIRVVHARSIDELNRPSRTSRVRQADQSPELGLALHGCLDVESRVPTRPLAQRAAIHSGTTGFVAQQIATSLADRPQEPSTWIRHDGGPPPSIERGFDFIVSGNIDRYQIRLGKVRFMKRSYHRPVLRLRGNQLSPAKWKLYQGSKIVMAGMTCRLEAALDPGGLALGVQVYAMTDFADDPRYLLGLLNSKLMSHLFRLRFQAKRLAGGYLAINKSQLARLPIRIVDFSDAIQRDSHQRIVQHVKSLLACTSEFHFASDTSEGLAIQRRIERSDQEIDGLVYKMYGLTKDEVEQVERAVGQFAA